MVIDARTGLRKWTYDNPEHGVTDIAVGNLDGDAANEIVHGAGWSSGGADHLYVYDSVTRAFEWESTDFGGPCLAIDHGDLNGDGTPDFVYGSWWTDSGYGDPMWFVHNAVTKAFQYHNPHYPQPYSDDLFRIKHANVDADPQPELFLTAPTGSGKVVCLDGQTLFEEYRTPALDMGPMEGMEIADIDLDGQLDLVVGSHGSGVPSPGSFVYVFNAANGALRWQSSAIGGSSAQLCFLRVANVDADANLEIVVGDRGRSLYVVDGVTRLTQFATADINLSALDTADLDGDGVSEIIVGTDQGAITVRSPIDGSVVTTLGTFTGAAIDGLQVRDVAGGPGADLIFGRAGELRVVFKDLANVTQSWASGFIANNAGNLDSIIAADIDGDGKIEVLMGDGSMGFRMYEITR